MCVTIRDNFVTPYTQICGVKSDACLPTVLPSFLLTEDVVTFSCALSTDMANATHQSFMRRVLGNMEVHHRIHNNPPFDCIVHQMNLVTPSSSTASASIYIRLPLGFPSRRVPSFSDRNSVPTSHLSRASCNISVSSSSV